MKKTIAERDAFLDELSALSLKHGIYIAGMIPWGDPGLFGMQVDQPKERKYLIGTITNGKELAWPGVKDRVSLHFQ